MTSYGVLLPGLKKASHLSRLTLLTVWKQAAVRSSELLLPLLPSVDPAILQNKPDLHQDADD